MDRKMKPYPLLITPDGCTIMSDGVVISSVNTVIGYTDPGFVQQTMYMEQMAAFEMLQYTVMMEQQMLYQMQMQQQMQMEQQLLMSSQAEYVEPQSVSPLYSSYVFQNDDSVSQHESMSNDFTLEETHPGVRFAEMLLAC